MRKRARILLMAWLAFSWSVGSSTPCEAGTSVTLVGPYVDVSGDTVRLSDLFSGLPSAADRDIAQAPPACEPALYDSAVLDTLAQAYRLDWSSSREGVAHVTVASACSHITSAMIRQAVRARLQNEGALKKVTFDVAFDRRDPSLDVAVDGTPSFSLDKFFYDPTTRAFRAVLEAETPRGRKTLALSGKTLVRYRAPILSKRIEAHAIIRSSDLDWIEVPEERVTADIVTEADQLVGREVKRNLPEGELVSARDIMPQRLVPRGSLVTLKIETPYILMTTQGKAQEDGAEGDVIRVINTQSNRVIEGVVVAPGVVEVRVARKVALAR
ncbi:MAG: flagellar basal body P-ring formation chaperone FlgA [Alphaproteobacteria bacterium]|nr:flagellar basal body P-ring formation chaperone FlgA [Alphaproteobacteria bacterium]